MFEIAKYFIVCLVVASLVIGAEALEDISHHLNRIANSDRIKVKCILPLDQWNKDIDDE